MSEETLNPDFIALLRCPQDHSSLKVMTKRSLNALNKKIEQGTVKRGDGRVVSEPVEQVLVREDRRIGYLCTDGVALLNAQDSLVLKD